MNRTGRKTFFEFDPDDPNYSDSAEIARIFSCDLPATPKDTSYGAEGNLDDVESFDYEVDVPDYDNEKYNY